MSKLYVPSYTNNSCIVVHDSDTIWVFNDPIQQSVYNTYTIYYVNSHYMTTKSSIKYDYVSQFPRCESLSNITDSFLYRNDLFDILGCFFIILLVCFYFPFKIFSRAFGRWLKV